jgi:hypothetical protein
VDAAHRTSPSTERRRSERIYQTVSVVVRGIDLLGQPFDERTNAVELNLHGCKYSSRHHLPKNTWVTLEIPVARSIVRARVARVQRPQSIRDLFQIALELERPVNIWGVESAPADWENAESLLDSALSSAHENLREAEASEAHTVPTTLATFLEKMAAPMTNELPQFPVPEEPSQGQPNAESTFPEAAESQSPLLRELANSMDQQARSAAEAAATHAAEKVREALEQFEHKIHEAEHLFAERLSARQEEFERGWKAQLERLLEQSREVVARFEGTAEALRAETQGAQEAIGHLARVRLQMEVAEAARNDAPAESPRKEETLSDHAAAAWRERLESEMALAQAQWKELLDSSLDSRVERLAEQLSARAQDVLRDAERSLSERSAKIRQPLDEISADARAAVASIKSSLEQEVADAHSSLTEIERLAVRLKEHSAQLEAASHDTLNDLHRRLERILESKTEELNRRAENLAAGVPERLTPALDTLCQQLVERVVREVDAQLGPRLSRVPELVHELASREMQAEESLRLHRERLRQASESSQREIASQIAGIGAHLREDFESARKDALTKWNEELDAAGVRASHASAEAIGRSSEWFQQEARARLQVLVEQTTGSAANSLEERAAEARQQFGVHLTETTAARLAGIQQNIDVLALELASKARSHLDEAAEAAAASFGEVLRGISVREAAAFDGANRASLEERRAELTAFAQERRSQFGADCDAGLDQLRAQISAQVNEATLQARGTLASEVAAAVDLHRTDRETQQAEWASQLDRLGAESAGKYQERLQTAGDAWQISSVRRLNEHGQNVIESLMRSSDQALRDSCSKVLEGLAATLRERSASANGVGLPSMAPQSLQSREPNERE